MTLYCIERWRVDERTGHPTVRSVHGPYPDRATGYAAMDAMTLYPRSALRLVTLSNGNLCQVAVALGASGIAPTTFAEESLIMLVPTVEAPV